MDDKFYAGFPSISPDGHYVAFLKWAPTHLSSDLNLQDHYMLYDLTKDSRQNRPKEVSIGDLETVGKCFYPVGTANMPGDNLHATPGSEHFARSLLFWSPDSSQLVFADQVGSNSVLNIVLASIHSEADVGIISTEQSIEDLCITRDGKKVMCPVLMRKATFVAGNAPRIDAIFELVKVQVLRTRSYSISEFRS
jgi:Tol biopolymer transport system component